MSQNRFFHVLSKASGILPEFGRLTISSGLGAIGYQLYGAERNLALRNIRACFPSQSSSAHKQITIRSFQHTILSALDVLRFADDANARQPLFNVKNRERIVAALARGRGVILITGHYGNLGTLPFALKGICPNPAYLWHRPTREIAWAVAQFRHYKDSYLRPRSGFHRLDSSVRGLIKAGHLLKRGNAIIMAADLTWGSGVTPLSFLGVPYYMSRVPASISLRTNAPLLPIITVRKPDGSYDVVVEDPIETPGAISNRSAEQIMTERFARILERYVRSCPEQWCWVHRDSWLAGTN
jgi:KDO2-lipid IV(A) lauroyltransferase